jgi:transposase
MRRSIGQHSIAGQKLHYQQVTGKTNRETSVNFLDDLITLFAKPTPTLIALDNARIHHGLDNYTTWRWMIEHNTFLCYLPPYSPELNMLEILWK